MQNYVKVSLILCAYGFLREMRPSEPFVSEFLLDKRWRNITDIQLNRQVYPVGTFSSLAQLFIIFLITDILRYKPIIILSSCVGIVIYSMLLWTKDLLSLQIVQVIYGTFMAAEVAYYTYMYAKVDRAHYQKVTGYVRAAILTGRFSASLLGQILVSLELMNLRELNYVTLGAQALSLPLGALLPGVGVSLYFYSASFKMQAEPSINKEGGSDEKLANGSERVKFSLYRAKQLIWTHFVQGYSNFTILQSSIWWALVMAGFLMIQSYVQLLWKIIDEKQKLFNGGVEAILTLLGACGALIAGLINMKMYEKYCMWILSVCASLAGTLTLVSAYTTNIFVAYVMYILFGVLYNFMITLISAHVAKQLADDSFGLIFGINTFLALVFQTVLTILVTSESGFALDVRQQFVTFGGYFMGLSVIYIIVAVVQFVLKRTRNQV
ncbi:thiamine transporter 1-like [Culicoides brevitarsis]|uniref:thiamine transporter 1-like n=1 Tax=Culicoides brevitarsis TaxID=469753 RepID=UPI00307C48AE